MAQSLVRNFTVNLSLQVTSLILACISVQLSLFSSPSHHVSLDTWMEERGLFAAHGRRDLLREKKGVKEDFEGRVHLSCDWSLFSPSI